MERDQIAINSVTNRNADMETCLAAYADAGFGNVDFMLAHVHYYLADGHTTRDVKRLLHDHGIRCIGAYDVPLTCFGDGEDRRANHARLREDCALLAELGAGFLAVGTDGPPDVHAVDDRMGHIADVLADVAGQVEGTGITLCLEFNWAPTVKSLRTAAEIARRTGADNVGVLFDSAHYHCTPTKFDQISADNVRMIRHVHIADMRDKPGELSHRQTDRVLPGEGFLDLSALFGEIEAHGYQDYFSLELFHEGIWSKPPSEFATALYEATVRLCR